VSAALPPSHPRVGEARSVTACKLCGLDLDRTEHRRVTGIATRPFSSNFTRDDLAALITRLAAARAPAPTGR